MTTTQEAHPWALTNGITTIRLCATCREPRYEGHTNCACPKNHPDPCTQRPYEVLKDALESVNYELAALIPNPSNPRVEDWPNENPADRRCLQNAFVAVRVALDKDRRHPAAQRG